MKVDLIESVIVLPSKLFYGNAVPACLVVLNKRKAPERNGKILLIWASRNFQSDNPQNVLRRADCLRILLPWRAFGDAGVCRSNIPQYEQEFVGEIERERDAALAEIEEAYAPFFSSLASFLTELSERELLAQTKKPVDKQEKKEFLQRKKENVERLKVIKREIKALEKLKNEAEEKRASVRLHSDREITLVKAAAADLLRICSDPEEIKRYFVVTERAEIDENEFNLNLPRYVDTFAPEEQIEIGDALKAVEDAEIRSADALKRLRTKLEALTEVTL